MYANRRFATLLRLGKIFALCLPLGLMGLASTSQALPDDRNQPIRITADSAVRDENAGATRYEGSVVLTQGSLVIEADSLSIEQSNDAVSVITAIGSPAHMRQTPAPDQAPINASAGQIVYRQQDDQITLTDNPRIEQDGAVVSGGVIEYLVSEQRVLASGSEGTDGQRVEVIIPPSAIEDS